MSWFTDLYKDSFAYKLFSGQLSNNDSTARAVDREPRSFGQFVHDAFDKDYLKRGIPADFQRDVDKYMSEGDSRWTASWKAGFNETAERLGAVSEGPEAVAKAVSGDYSAPVVSNSYGTSGAPAGAKSIIYSNWSPAAQHFGMDQATAYSEHMANTAHQREVADLRAAGLNPVLGLGSGASGVSGSVASSIGSGYSGSSSAKKDNSKFIDALGATSAVIATLVTKNPTTGGMIGTAIKALGKAFDD